jgi:branched-chain amino acid transport system substrate-binding protein
VANRRDVLKAAGAVALAGFPAIAVRASKGPILIGQTAAFSGGPAGTVRELTLGASLYIDHINAMGGIGGRTIRVIQEDDGFQPDRARDNASKLIKAGCAALFLTRGTPTAEKMLPVLREAGGIPLIAPSTGAMSLRAPVLRNVFNVRSSYRLEGERIIPVLKNLAWEHIGVITVDDSFGKDVMNGVLPGFKAAGIDPMFVEKFERTTTDFGGLCKRVAEKSPQAVMIVAATEPTVKIIKGLSALKCTSRLVTMSTNASHQFIAQLGGLARGVGVSQVFPNPKALGIRMVADATKLLQRHSQKQGKEESVALTPAMLEGYASARVLVEGLSLARGQTQPEALIEAFEQIRDFNVGWRSISYSSADHNGFEFADLSAIGVGGRFLY